MKLHVLFGRTKRAPDALQRIEALAVATDRDLEHYAYRLESEKESWEIHVAFERMAVAVLEVPDGAVDALLDGSDASVASKVLKKEDEA